MSKFSKIAQEVTSLSPLMEGREKMSMDDLMNRYQSGVTVTGFDMVESGKDRYPVFVFIENPSAFVCGGKIMANICDAWAKEYNGDCEEASADLAREGGVRMRFYASKTKSGNNLTKVDIL